MKNVKNLIIASALSMITAGCYAGSLVPNTSTSVSADISFSNPGQLQALLTPVAGLRAGQHSSGDVIAQLKVSGSVKQFAITGDYSKPETVNSSSDVWKVKGKNGNTMTVSFQGSKWTSKGSLVDGAAHKWWIYNMGDGINVVLSGAQTVNADIYPVTLNVAAYQA
ncbi:Saf-pilin pilus formation protein SafA [Salmonella enterica]|uniref:Saf-pilin pilus formation protein SafA n=1 Tax=Salmonella enterica subsp. enterica serovar Kouka TaxID=2564646 RepID=A0A729L3X7_SALET|nr:Saf-pilin pilus formation protein SafA [Salmonella enterica]EBU2369924.1 Saf-pilin pilus formation protein SafA [Salmonella enterica subsp. enterica]EEB7261197.1 Saf-pilin pilus formation protein SafA [Salmonella enterica subsp. enterica serovar Senftenberg]EEJ6226524.1 Saf-pilin pilus formation protein SafA [Salmonella enterica subsp. enterica serovar Southbank]EHF9036727.1 Saf-pilin pilus formation protein SafA [Salmonella enterica subsp. enterica serovar 1,3,19:g,m,t:-]HAE3283711.1 Saf-p